MCHRQGDPSIDAILLVTETHKKGSLFVGDPVYQF